VSISPGLECAVGMTVELTLREDDARLVVLCSKVGSVVVMHNFVWRPSALGIFLCPGPHAAAAPLASPGLRSPSPLNSRACIARQDLSESIGFAT
jgi:hypothetical protein